MTIDTVVWITDGTWQQVIARIDLQAWLAIGWIVLPGGMSPTLPLWPHVSALPPSSVPAEATTKFTPVISEWEATVATGSYSIGDQLRQTVWYDSTNPALPVQATIWINRDTRSVISAPPAAHYGPPSGAGVNIADLAIGATTDPAVIDPSLVSTESARSKGVLQRLASLIGVLPPTIGPQSPANSLAVTDQAIGLQGDAAYSGTGNSTVIGAIKGLFAGLGGATAGAANPVGDRGQQLRAVLDVVGSAASTAAEESVRGDLVRVLAGVNLILDELVNSKSIADTIVQDSSATPRYFIRQETINQTTGLSTVAIVNLQDGSAPSPAPVLPLQPIKSAATGNVVESDNYTTLAAGTGYGINESITNIRILSGETGLVLASSWWNKSLGAVITPAPVITNLKSLDDEIQELLFAINNKLPPTIGPQPPANSLATTDGAIGATTDPAVIDPFLNSTESARSKGFLQRFATLLGLLPPAIGPQLPANSFAVTDQAIGLPADAAWVGTGNATLIAAIKALFAGLGGATAGAASATGDRGQQIRAVLDLLGNTGSLSTDQSVRGDLIRILNELVSAKAISDLVVQDSSATPRYFIRQETIDQTTGAVSIALHNLDGTNPSPAPTLPLLPYRAVPGNTVQEIYYTSKVAGTGYAANESIVFTRFFDASNALVASNWYNVSQGITIATAPPIANLDGLQDKLEELLTLINAKLPTLGNKLAAGSISATIASDDAQLGTVLTEVRTLQSRFTAPVALTDLLPNPTTTQVGANLLAWTGTQFERLRSASGRLATAPTLKYLLNRAGRVDGAIDTLTGDISGSLRVATTSVLGYPIPEASVGASAVNAEILASTDISEYSHVTLQIGGSFVATYIIEQSSNANFSPPVFSVECWSDVAKNFVTQGTENDLMLAPVRARYLRVRLTSYTSGSAFCSAMGRTGPSELLTRPRKPTYTNGGSISPAADTLVSAPLVGLSKIQLTNPTAGAVYMMIFSKATALAAGDLPVNGWVARVPPSATLGFGRGDLGEFGTKFGPNLRIGLSSTPGSYTAASTSTIALHFEVAA